MPRGRHRYIPPRRLVIPAGIGGCAVLAAGAALLTGGMDGLAPHLLVVLTAGAGVTGALLMRRRDAATDALIAQERSARAVLKTLLDERQTELDAAGERVVHLEEKLQGKRIDLSRLRNEHADLLRRYARAEHGRASALESRRVLELEGARPTRALPAGPTDHRSSSGAPTALTYVQAAEALRNLARNAARQRSPQPTGPSPAPPQLRPQPLHQPQPPAPLPQAPRAPRQPRAPRPGGGFDFFGNSTGAAPELPAGQQEPPSPGGTPSRRETPRPGPATEAATGPAAPEPGPPEYSSGRHRRLGAPGERGAGPAATAPGGETSDRLADRPR